jgi:chromate transporter
MKIGALTFGGGYAMLPVLDREVIRKKGWVTMDEVMNYYTIAQITPGVIGVNTATFVGRHVKGNAGGVLASLAFVLPGTLLMAVVAWGLRGFADHPVARHAFAGIRVAVSALILDTVGRLIKGVLKDAGAVVIMLAVFALAAIFNPSPAFLIVPAGVFGLFFYRPAPQGPSSDAARGEVSSAFPREGGEANAFHPPKGDTEGLASAAGPREAEPKGVAGPPEAE